MTQTRKTPQVRISVACDERLKEDIDNIALVRGTTPSVVVRKVLRAYVRAAGIVSAVELAGGDLDPSADDSGSYFDHAMERED